MASAFNRPCSLAFGSLLLFSALLGALPGCGESESDGEKPAGEAGKGASAGTAGSSAGALTGTAGSASGGSTSGSGSGGSVTSNGGKSSGGEQAAGGTASQGGSDSAGAAGASTDLVDCDPMKITCKRAAPECPAGEVPSVDDIGNCYGDCVKIAHCACSTAAQCPDPNQYTCWAKQHCGPFVQ